MQMKRVASSHMAAVGYDPTSRRMHIEFKNGAKYEYRGVPQQFHDTMMSAPDSIGEFFHQNVKPYFKGTKLA